MSTSKPVADKRRLRVHTAAMRRTSLPRLSFAAVGGLTVMLSLSAHGQPAPGKTVPGTKMLLGAPDAEQRAAVIQYLGSLKK